MFSSVFAVSFTAAGMPLTVTVTVAVTLKGETDLTRRLWTSDFLNQFVLVFVAGVLIMKREEPWFAERV